MSLLFRGLIFFPFLFSISCPSGLRIPGFIIIIIFAQRGCGYLRFNNFLYFFKFAHRGCGYLLLIFFFHLSPSGPRIPAVSLSLPLTLWPIGAMDTCFKKKRYFMAHRGLGYLLLFFFFFPCPSGPRIPALIFFSLPIGAVDTCLDFFFLMAHRGLLWMEMLAFVVRCTIWNVYKFMLLISRLVLCEWTYGFGWEMT